MKQSGESLAGRITYIDLTPLSITEIPQASIETLWIRGGFPDSFLAPNAKQSFQWRKDLLRAYLERDVPMFGSRIPAETLRRFWTMLAHHQGSLFNASKLASGLEVSSQAVSRYADLLVDLLLVRRLQPYHVNVGKRLVKSPKIFIRDSGLLHALLNIDDRESLLGHPIVGMSWEGFAIEIKRSKAAKPGRGFFQAYADLQPSKSFVVHAGFDRYPIDSQTEAIGVLELVNILRTLD